MMYLERKVKIIRELRKEMSSELSHTALNVMRQIGKDTVRLAVINYGCNLCPYSPVLKGRVLGV